MGGVSKLIGILEYWNNWNTGTTGTLFFLRGFSSAVMPLLSKALPFQGCPPL